MALRIASSVFATIFVGFGINAIVRPEHALTFFHYESPTSTYEKNVVDSLLIVYGARDIFMGLAIYAAAYFGSAKALGWILISGSAVAFVDGWVCKTMAGEGEWDHWGYAPMLTVVGAALLGGFGR